MQRLYYEAWEPNERGRHLRASQDLRAGELVLVEEPSICMAIAPRREYIYEGTEMSNSEQAGSGSTGYLMCDHCGSVVSETTLQRCRRCSAVHYCSRTCAERASCLHEKTGECRAIVLARNALAIRSAVLSEVPHRFLLRAMAMNCHRLATGNAVAESGFRTNAVAKPGMPDAICDLTRQLKAHVPDQGSCEHTAMRDLVAAIRDAVRDTPLGRVAPSTPELIELMSAGIRNSYSLHASEESEVAGAVGMYMQLSAMNHNCRPTCESYNIGNTVHVRTVQPVAKGGELTIAYVPEWFSVSRRRRELLQQYKFECTCQRCTEQSERQPQVESGDCLDSCPSKRKHETPKPALASSSVSCAPTCITTSRKRRTTTETVNADGKRHAVAQRGSTTMEVPSRIAGEVDVDKDRNTTAGYLQIDFQVDLLRAPSNFESAAGDGWRMIMKRAQAAIATAQAAAAHPECCTRTALMRVITARRLNDYASNLLTRAEANVDEKQVVPSGGIGDDSGWRSRLATALLGHRFKPAVTVNESLGALQTVEPPTEPAVVKAEPRSFHNRAECQSIWLEGVAPLLSEAARVLSITRGADRSLVASVRAWLAYGGVPFPVD